MPATHELMELGSANVVGLYPTGDEALAVVADTYERHGPDAVEDLALAEKSADSPSLLIAEGEELVRLATSARGARADALTARA